MEKWNGQRFVMSHVSGQLEKLSLVAVSGPEQCLGSVQKALQSFRLLCLLLCCCVERGLSQPCPVTVGCTAQPLQHCPPGQAGDRACHWELSMLETSRQGERSVLQGCLSCHLNHLLFHSQKFLTQSVVVQTVSLGVGLKN